jgi:hypothetical protein
VSRASIFRYGLSVSQPCSIARRALDPLRFRLAAPCADPKSRIGSSWKSWPFARGRV